MSDSDLNPSSLTPSLTDAQQHDALQYCFPHAGYWFGMLPTHPFIHGSQGAQLALLGPGNTPGPYGAANAPPYAPMPARTQPVQPALGAPSNLSVSIPLNTSVVGDHLMWHACSQQVVLEIHNLIRSIHIHVLNVSRRQPK
ncbi:hypothetical protein EDC04DRAFT_2598729 [Pisolithus marmoratus]|nr:hypothetical protein EDC04DRAFT_2598729 [Pisolithus marmoratus]